MKPKLVFLAAAAGTVLYVYAGSQHAGTATTTTAASPGSVPSGALSCSGLESLWEQAGGSPSAAFMAAEIATAESSGNPGATDDDGNGTVDRGLWQINSIWPGSTYDELRNAQAAVQISHDGTDWLPWVTYSSGAYEGKCRPRRTHDIQRTV